MYGWLILGGFFAYWYLLKKGTTQSLVDVIRNELSGFAAVNQAGLATGAIRDPGRHAGYPGDCATPLGITTAEPGSMPSLNGTVATSADVRVPVGVLTARSPFKRYAPASFSGAPIGPYYYL